MRTEGILQSVLTRKLPLELVYRERATPEEDEDIRPAEKEKGGSTRSDLRDPLEEWHCIAVRYSSRKRRSFRESSRLKEPGNS